MSGQAVAESPLLDSLRASFDRYLGSETEALLGLWQLDERLLLKGQEQVRVLAELAGFPEDHPMVARLTVPYMILQSHYYLLDSAVDGQMTDADSLLGLAELLLLFTYLVDEELDAHVPPAQHTTIRRRLSNRMADRAAALRLERERRQGWLPPDEADEQTAVGRSNSVLLFYDLLCWLNGAEPDDAVNAALADLVYYLQLGDDLADWDKDLQGGNHTALLRECAARLGPNGHEDHAAIERELFLGGVYELYTARLVRGFEQIAARLRAMPHVQSTHAQGYADHSRRQALRLLTDVVRTKLEHFATDAAAAP